MDIEYNSHLQSRLLTVSIESLVAYTFFFLSFHLVLSVFSDSSSPWGLNRFIYAQTQKITWSNIHVCVFLCSWKANVCVTVILFDLCTNFLFLFFSLSPFFFTLHVGIFILKISNSIFRVRSNTRQRRWYAYFCQTYSHKGQKMLKWDLSKTNNSEIFRTPNFLLSLSC